ncbi:tail fiber protein [Aestuariivirga sp.]|uniref:tail fiber protein n=1 Tax=Aestuariivirga sp. TaxID=2650926 RepID=UPI00378334DC
MLFSGHYCPVDWLPANGQVLPVNSNQALYSIIGNMAGRARIPLRFPMLHLLQH